MDRFGPSEDCQDCNKTVSFGKLYHCQECMLNICESCRDFHLSCMDVTEEE